MEFSLHGSIAVISSMKTVLTNFRSLGLREAERGEFSKRYLKYVVNYFNFPIER